MKKLSAVLLSLLSLSVVDAAARSAFCRFHASGPCVKPDYFKQELTSGCAADGGRCRQKFCEANCVSNYDGSSKIKALCKAGCLGDKTLGRFSAYQRKGLYKNLLGLGKGASRREIERALVAEKRIAKRRSARQTGWFSWFRSKPSTSESLETLRLEKELKDAYIRTIANLWKSKKKSSAKLAIRQAAVELVPSRSGSRTSVADRRSVLALDIARASGVSESTAREVSAQVKRDSVNRVKPPVAPKPARLSQISRRLSSARASMATVPGNVPPPPPPPMEGFANFKPKSAVRPTLEDRATSANTMPAYADVATTRPALSATLQDEIRAGKRLRPTSSSSREDSKRLRPAQAGKADLLEEIQRGKSLRKVSDAQKNQYAKNPRVKASNPVAQGLYTAADKFKTVRAEEGVENSDLNFEQSWED